MNKIETIMQEKGTPSLKAIAAVFELPAVRLYTVAKQPKEGEVYDAHQFNWDAIERFINRRLKPDTELDTLEAVVAKALILDEGLKQSDGRRSRGAGEPYGAKVEVDGKLVAKRRYASFEIENGQFIVLKNDPDVYVMLLQTLSHTVIRPITNEPDGMGGYLFKGNEVKVISNGMLNFKGVGPSKLDEEVRARFEGRFVAATKTEATEAEAE